MGQSLADLSVAIRPPGTEMRLLKRLGEANFVPDPGLRSLLTPAYRAITQNAQEIAYQEETEEDRDE